MPSRCRAAEEIRIAADSSTSSRVRRYSGSSLTATTEVGQARQARRVGVVHEQLIAVAVDLVRPDLVAVFVVHARRTGCTRRSTSSASALHSAAKARSSCSARAICASWRSELTGEQVGRHEQRIDAGVVRRPEHRMDQCRRRGSDCRSRRAAGVSVGFAEGRWKWYGPGPCLRCCSRKVVEHAVHRLAPVVVERLACRRWPASSRAPGGSDSTANRSPICARPRPDSCR